jgi:hypothetical protein
MMRRTHAGWMSILVLTSLPVPAFAQRASTYEALTVDNTARSISEDTLSGQGSCVAVLETAEVRWRNDGTAPTSSVGTPIASGTTVSFSHIDDARLAQFIRTTGTSGVLHVNCFPTAGDVALTGSGSGGSSSTALEDDASANAMAGQVIFAIRDDTLDVRSGAEGDLEPFHTNANGALWIKDADYAADVSEGVVSSGTVPPVGGIVETAQSGMTLLDDADRFQLGADADRALYVRSYGSLADLGNSGAVDVSAGSSTSALASAGSGVKWYVTSVVCSNPVAGTDTLIDIRDGTAGSVKITIPCPAGGSVFNPPVPISGFSAATAVAVDPSAASTGLTVTVLAFKSKI